MCSRFLATTAAPKQFSYQLINVWRNICFYRQHLVAAKFENNKQEHLKNRIWADLLIVIDLVSCSKSVSNLKLQSYNWKHLQKLLANVLSAVFYIQQAIVIMFQ